jgi:TetR/AcrR family transcriptional regulator, transcriptional repressor of bet genes
MPRAVDHQQRRQQLTDALWRIADRGALEPISISDVAAEAGVSVGFVQHYFSNKAELLQLAVQSMGEQNTARARAKLKALPQPPDPLALVEIMIRERLPLTARQQGRGRVVLAWLTQIGYTAELRAGVAASHHRLCAVLAEYLGQGQTEGRVPAHIDPHVAAFGLWALQEGLTAGLLTGLHTRASALDVLDQHLNLLIPNRPRRNPASTE